MPRNRRLNNRTVCVVIPSSIGLDGGILDDKAATFLNYLLRRMHWGHQEGPNLWVPVHHGRLRQLLGSRYGQTIKRLHGAGIVEVDDSYSPKGESVQGYCKSYRLASGHRGNDFKIYVVSGHWAVERLKRYYLDDASLSDGGRHYWSHRASFSLGHHEAASMVRASKPSKKRFHRLQMICSFVNGWHFGSRCSFGRFHSRYTQFPRMLRELLCIDSHEPIAEIDVSSCQPLLLGYLANKMLEITSGAIDEEAIKQIIDNPSAINRDLLPLDLVAWIELAEAGKLYDQISELLHAEHAGLSWYGQTKKRRPYQLNVDSLHGRTSKNTILTTLFNTLVETRKSPVFDVLRWHFPTIADALVQLKSLDHRLAARSLQRLESTVMIDVLGSLLASEHPREPVQPIHDALLVRAGFADEAISMVKRAFATFGLAPSVRAQQSRHPYGLERMGGERRSVAVRRQKT